MQSMPTFCFIRSLKKCFENTTSKLQICYTVICIKSGLLDLSVRLLYIKYGSNPGPSANLTSIPNPMLLCVRKTGGGEGGRERERERERISGKPDYPLPIHLAHKLLKKIQHDSHSQGNALNRHLSAQLCTYAKQSDLKSLIQSKLEIYS